MERVIYYLFFLIFFVSCETTDQWEYQTLAIPGRNGQLIYEIDFPKNWGASITNNESIDDTTLSLCHLILNENNEKITLAIHNFPTKSIDDRIPIKAQILRWINQLEQNEEIKNDEKNESFGGFCGIKYQGVGKIKGIKQKMIAWAMELPEETYHQLNFSSHSKEKLLQMRSNYTLKVLGPEALVNKHQQTIEKIARSFRLIDDLN